MSGSKERARRWAWWVVAVIAATLVSAKANAQAQDFRVQAPTIAPPERGSIAGPYAATAFRPADLSRGVFRLPSAMQALGDRGGLPVSVFPSYSPEAGLSEWGLGWESTLSIARWREQGDLDFTSDELTGPWGPMRRGADGAFYPYGLASAVRVEVDGDRLVAYAEDGSVWVFGASERLTTTKGTFAWYLETVTAVTGPTATLTYEANTTGRRFLSRVEYATFAGRAQHALAFSYAPLTVPLVDYRAGQQVALDRRVQRVTAASRQRMGDAWDERYHYDLAYENDDYGPAFFLKRVTQVFSSGSSMPPVTYTHARSAARLQAAALVRSEKLSRLLGDTVFAALTAQGSTILDADADGRLDVELASSYALYRQGEDAFVREDLEPTPEGANLLCRTNNGFARTLVPFAGAGTALLVTLTQDDPDSLGDTRLVLCDRNGTERAKLRLSGVVNLKTRARIGDVNRDGKPDLVRYFAGFAEVAPNTSTESALSLGAFVRSALAPAVTPDAVHLQDMNGDGIVDLVAQKSSTLTVWYGLGQYGFAPNGVAFPVTLSDGGLVDSLQRARLSFADVNRDGLADLLVVRGTAPALFVNDGSALRLVRPPVLATTLNDVGTLYPLDMIGSGNTELSIRVGNDGYSIALDGPETSLLVHVDDGRGSVLELGYGRGPAAPGLQKRPAVLTTMKRSAVGVDDVVEEYAYGDAAFHSRSLHFLGFRDVRQRGVFATSRATFLHDDDATGVLLADIDGDSRDAAFERVKYTEYERASLRGVPWYRATKSGQGYHGLDPMQPRVLEDETAVLGYAADRCPTQTRRTSIHGNEIGYVELATNLPAFAQSLACLTGRVIVAGTHADPSLDYREERVVERNEQGLVTRVGAADNDGQSLELQTVTYAEGGRPRTVAAPGKGTTAFDYDPVTGVITGVTSPDGSQILAERAANDLVEALTIVRGDLSFTQRFAYDGLERLERSWHSLGGASAAQPNERLSYQYADVTTGALAAVRATVLARLDGGVATQATSVSLASPATGVLAIVRQTPDGWTTEKLTATERTSGTTRAYARGAFSIDEPMSLTTAALYGGADEIVRTTASALGTPLSEWTAYHAGVARTVTGDALLESELKVRLQENGTFTSARNVDASARVLASEMPDGATWTTVRDAQGRARVGTLPSGERHRVSYDAFGRPSRIVRDAIARVDLAYDPVTGLLAKKAFSAPEGGEELRSVRYARDAIGRVVTETHTAGAGSETFTFFYDGATPDAPTARGQTGFLTGVSGPGYTKAIRFRADGKVALSRLAVAGFRTLSESFVYDEDGAVRSRTSDVTTSVGAPVSRVVHGVDRDAYGRTSKLRLNDDALADIGYDREGFPAWLTFGSSHANREVVTFQRDPLTRRRTGINVAAATWSAALSSRMNDRGFVDREVFDIGGTRRERAYDYTPNGYLASAADDAETYSYGYEANGLLRLSASGSDATTYVRAPGKLTAGEHVYSFDPLGRVVDRDDLHLQYGPSGHVATATRGERSWGYLYDETGSRLAKTIQGAVVAMFPADGTYLGADTGLVEPLSEDGILVGLVLHGTDGTPARFEPMAADARGTRLSDSDGSARLASPYGARVVHPALAEAIDYAAKGWDADLGTVRMGVRDYDPALGLFLQPDPLFLEDLERGAKSPIEASLYGYARSNPLSFLDPTGMEVIVGPDLKAISGGPTPGQLWQGFRQWFKLQIFDEKAYQSMKSSGLPTVGPNPALDMTDAIVKETPEASSKCLMVMQLSMAGPAAVTAESVATAGAETVAESAPKAASAAEGAAATEAASFVRELEPADLGLGRDAQFIGRIEGVKGGAANVSVDWVGGDVGNSGMAALARLKEIARAEGATSITIQTSRVVEVTGVLRKWLTTRGFESLENGTMRYQGPL